VIPKETNRLDKNLKESASNLNLTLDTKNNELPFKMQEELKLIAEQVSDYVKPTLSKADLQFSNLLIRLKKRKLLLWSAESIKRISLRNAQLLLPMLSIKPDFRVSIIVS